MKKKYQWGQIVLNTVFIIICLTYLIPLIMVVSVSFTDQTELIQHGYNLIPRKFSTLAYEVLFQNGIGQMLRSYGVTIAFSLISTVLSTLVMGLMAYPLARNNFLWKRQLNFFIYFTMLFSGGLVPSYILIRNYLHLYNNFWVYILPGLVSAYSVMIIRTNYRAIPYELIESAKIDGASELYICFRIVMPLSKAGLSSIAFLHLVGKWNDWMTSMLYVDNMKLYSLQYLLQRLLQEAEFLKNATSLGGVGAVTSSVQLPTDSLRFAMALVAAGPVLVIFPFFQKYFAKGMTIGGVKG